MLLFLPIMESKWQIYLSNLINSGQKYMSICQHETFPENLVRQHHILAHSVSGVSTKEAFFVITFTPVGF